MDPPPRVRTMTSIPRIRPVDPIEGFGDLPGGHFSLDQDREDAHLYVPETPVEDANKIPDRGPGRGSDHGHPAGQERQGLLTGFFEKPFLLEPFFQALEGQLQGTPALQLHPLQDELVLPPAGVDADPPLAQDLEPVFRFKVEPPLAGPKKYRP